MIRTVVTIFRRRSGSAASIPANLPDAIRLRLLGQASLASLTGIYQRAPRSGAAFPYLVISKINETPELNTGSDYQEHADYQLTVAATDDETAESLGKAVFRALMPNPSNPPLLFADGAETIRLPLFSGRLLKTTGRDKLNQNVWVYHCGYRILAVRSRY